MSRGAGGRDDEEAGTGKSKRRKAQDKPAQPLDFTFAELARLVRDLIDLIEADEAAEETTEEATEEAETTDAETQPEPPTTDTAPPTHTAPQTHAQAHRATPRTAMHAYTHTSIQADTRHQSGTSGVYYAGVMMV